MNNIHTPLNHFIFCLGLPVVMLWYLFMSFSFTQQKHARHLHHRKFMNPTEYPMLRCFHIEFGYSNACYLFPASGDFEIGGRVLKKTTYGAFMFVVCDERLGVSPRFQNHDDECDALTLPSLLSPRRQRHREGHLAWYQLWRTRRRQPPRRQDQNDSGEAPQMSARKFIDTFRTSAYSFAILFNPFENWIFLLYKARKTNTELTWKSDYKALHFLSNIHMSVDSVVNIYVSLGDKR